MFRNKKMVHHIMYCDHCKRYTLHEVCPKCGTKTHRVKVIKYSPHDPYGKYRRELKFKEILERYGEDVETMR